MAPFVDYRSADGQYRKFRIALVGRRPFLCHMAISNHWNVHYGNSGMDCDPGKRAEECQMMETFDKVFVPRHQTALSTLADRIGLDFVVIDCAETKDGELLFFEADHASAVHGLDPPQIFPYKRAHMSRLFDAFAQMLKSAAAR